MTRRPTQYKGPQFPDPPATAGLRQRLAEREHGLRATLIRRHTDADRPEPHINTDVEVVGPAMPDRIVMVPASELDSLKRAFLGDGAVLAVIKHRHPEAHGDDHNLTVGELPDLSADIRAELAAAWRAAEAQGG